MPAGYRPSTGPTGVAAAGDDDSAFSREGGTRQLAAEDVASSETGGSSSKGGRAPYVFHPSIPHLPSFSGAIQEIISSIDSMPHEVAADTPATLVTPLLPHQDHALSWLLWREGDGQAVRGGIFGDDMGLGKTLSLIALILADRMLFSSSRKPSSSSATSALATTKSNTTTNGNMKTDVWSSDTLSPTNSTTTSSSSSLPSSSASTLSLQHSKSADASDMNVGPTLVVCPSSLLGHWRDEINQHVQAGVLRVILYHGPTRHTDVQRIKNNSVVITTYKIMSMEGDQGQTESLIFSTHWRRVVLDEGHTIKNSKAQMSQAAFALRADCRWIVSGTPIHNSLSELHSLIMFLRCPGLENEKVWKREIAGKSEQCKAKLNALMSCLLLRRMKDGRSKDGSPLLRLPPRKVIRHEVQLFRGQRYTYEALWKTRSKFLGSEAGAGGMLVLLLRLRLCCMHPTLSESNNESNIQRDDKGIMEDLEDDLLSALQSMKLNDEGKKQDAGAATKTDTPLLQGDDEKLENVGKDVPKHGAKLDLALTLLKEILRSSTDGKANKVVIVSQWTKMLDVVRIHIHIYVLYER